MCNATSSGAFRGLKRLSLNCFARRPLEPLLPASTADAIGSFPRDENLISPGGAHPQAPPPWTQVRIAHSETVSSARGKLADSHSRVGGRSHRFGVFRRERSPKDFSGRGLRARDLFRWPLGNHA